MFQRLLGLSVIAASSGLLGCGQTATPPPGKVRGTVTFQGRPLAGGLIVFAPDRDRGELGRAVSTTISQDGTYSLSLDGAATVAPGWYRVAIADPPGVFTPEFGYPRFPTALRRPDRSGLTREVKSNAENVFDFPIEVPQ